MTDSLGNQNFQLNRVAQKDNMGRVLGICAFFAVLLFLRAGSNLFFYVFAGVSLLTFAVGSVPLCMYLLLFLLPFSTILKVNANDITFYTPLFFLTVFKMLLEQKGIQKNTFFAIVAFAAYALLISGDFQITTVATMSCGFLMLYFLRKTKVDSKIAVTVFALGIVLASVLALVKNSFPLIGSLVADSALKTGEGEYTSRFSGLVGNPNFYTMDNTIALSAIVVFMLRKMISQKYIGYILLLSVFGIMSVSKSFLVCWLILMAIWLFLSIRQGGSGGMKYFLIIAICLVGVYIFAFDAINAYLFRLDQDASGGLNEIFTGRIDVWGEYLKVIFSNLKIFLLGVGKGSAIKFSKGSHNTYLGTLCSLGVIGSGIFIVALKQSYGRIVTKSIMWIPVLMLLIRMLTIGFLGRDNLWLYLALFVIMAKELTDEEQSSLREQQ